MSYIAAADFRVPTLKHYCVNLALGEGDGTDEYIDAMIALAQTRVESDLNDVFQPAVGDPDETIDVDAWGGPTLTLPRRTRALTTVSTRDGTGTLTAQGTGTWRLRSSLNAAGTLVVAGLDELIVQPGLSTILWPWGSGTVQLVGKFGWTAPPDDVKRLVALITYDMVKAKADPLSTILQRQTIDATLTLGPSAEITDIQNRYRRVELMTS